MRISDWSSDVCSSDLPVPQTYADTEITVTGSRIQRDGFRAPTPLTVLNSEDIESSAPANIADYVNDIPSLVGSVTPASSNLNISAGTAGVNALNLRALGTARTLVLLDGQRSVGSTMTGLVDVDRKSTRLNSSH